MKKEWIPEIIYWDESVVPSINVPQGRDMPNKLLIFGCFETGEFEPGPDGKPIPIVDQDIYQYFSYNHLKDIVDSETLDKVRIAMGLDELKKAKKIGENLTNKVKNNVSNKKGN